MIRLEQAFLNPLKVIIIAIFKADIFNFGDFDEFMLSDNFFAVSCGVLFFVVVGLMRELVHWLHGLLLGAEILPFLRLALQLGLYGLDLI